MLLAQIDPDPLQKDTVTYMWQNGSVTSEMQSTYQPEMHKQAGHLGFGNPKTLTDSALSMGLETFISS